MLFFERLTFCLICFRLLPMDHYIHEIAVFLRHHMDSVSVGLVASLLITYGASINNFFKKVTKGIPFIGRFVLFILLYSVGYVFLSSQVVRLLSHLLYGLGDLVLFGVVLGAFIVLAIIAYKGKDV